MGMGSNWLISKVQLLSARKMSYEHSRSFLLSPCPVYYFEQERRRQTTFDSSLKNIQLVIGQVIFYPPFKLW